MVLTTLTTPNKEGRGLVSQLRSALSLIFQIIQVHTEKHTYLLNNYSRGATVVFILATIPAILATIPALVPRTLVLMRLSAMTVAATALVGSVLAIGYMLITFIVVEPEIPVTVNAKSVENAPQRDAISIKVLLYKPRYIPKAQYRNNATNEMFLTQNLKPEVVVLSTRSSKMYTYKSVLLFTDIKTFFEAEDAQTPVQKPSMQEVPVLLLNDIDTPFESEVVFSFDQMEYMEDINFSMAITAGYSADLAQPSQDEQDPVSEISLERTDKTWAGRALPLSTVRQIVSQYDWNVEKALRIVFCESGRNPRIINDTPRTRDYSVGLFQINLFHLLENMRPSEEWLKNPINNVEYAYKLYQNHGWNPWKTCSAKADKAMSQN